MPVSSQPPAPSVFSTCVGLKFGETVISLYSQSWRPRTMPTGRVIFGPPFMTSTLNGRSRLASRRSTGTASVLPRFSIQTRASVICPGRIVCSGAAGSAAPVRTSTATIRVRMTEPPRILTRELPRSAAANTQHSSGPDAHAHTPAAEQGSVEVVRVEVDVDAAHALHLLGANGGDPVLVLQHAVDNQERLLDDDEAVAGEEVGADDGVGDARFVLEREEHEVVRGVGTLARDDHAGDADAASLPRGQQVARANNAARGELVAAQRHRVAAG